MILQKKIIGNNSVSSIIGSYKSELTKHANRMGFNFEWQTCFHDHIIRNDNAYQRIIDNIDTSEVNWEKDKFLVVIEYFISQQFEAVIY